MKKKKIFKNLYSIGLIAVPTFLSAVSLSCSVQKNENKENPSETNNKVNVINFNNLVKFNNSSEQWELNIEFDKNVNSHLEIELQLKNENEEKELSSVSIIKNENYVNGKIATFSFKNNIIPNKPYLLKSIKQTNQQNDNLEFSIKEEINKEIVFSNSNISFTTNEKNKEIETSDFGNTFNLNYDLSSNDLNKYISLIIYELNNDNIIKEDSKITTDKEIISKKWISIPKLKENTKYLVKYALIYNNEKDSDFFVANLENNFIISTPKEILNKQDVEIKEIYSNLQNDKRVMGEFLEKRSMRITYFDELWNVYSDKAGKRSVLFPFSSINGTAWVIDKDPSDSENLTYYLATNIHVTKVLKFPQVYTNSSQLISQNNNYKQITEEKLSMLNNVFQAQASLNYDGSIPEKTFTNLFQNELFLLKPNDSQEWNDTNKNPVNTKLVSDILKKHFSYYNPQKDNGDNFGFNYDSQVINTNFQSPFSFIESYEIMEPLLYDHNFKNYWNLDAQHQPTITNYPNSGTDFSIIKIKLKNNIEKPEAFKEYDLNPTLIGNIQSEDGNNSKLNLNVFGYSTVVDSQQNAFEKNSFIGETTAKRYFNESLISFNNSTNTFIVDPKYNEFVTKETSILKENINFKNSQLESEGKFYYNNANFENIWYLNGVGILNSFWTGSSGSAVFDSNKILVGSLFATNAKKPGTIDNENSKERILFSEINPENKEINPILFYLNTRTSENSWLKKYWNSIQKILSKEGYRKD
ncbi:DUF31 family putative serine protease [Mycoplasma sp. AC157]